ncbi:MAG TPA: hypothetical protein VGD98_04030 [Ktedonobacteraceae bacterium]
MRTQQQLASPSRPVLALPTNWPARRDYRRAQRLARTLELAECQTIFLNPSAPKSARWYRCVLYYPLACLLLIIAIILIFLLTPIATVIWLMHLLAFLCILLSAYIYGALILFSFYPNCLDSEQIHLYANGFVAIDARGRRQGARWDQLFDFRRGAHQGNQRSGRVYWNIIRSAIANPRLGQRPTLKIIPQLPDSTEICARIERGYTDFWLPSFQEQLDASKVLDFDAFLLHRAWLGKTTPGSHRFTASLPRSLTSPDKKIPVKMGMARGLLTRTDTATPVEWLRRRELKSIRIEERFILIRTVEPVRRDKQGRADRVWFQVDMLELKDAALLKTILLEFIERN